MHHVNFTFFNLQCVLVLYTVFVTSCFGERDASRTGPDKHLWIHPSIHQDRVVLFPSPHQFLPRNDDVGRAAGEADERSRSWPCIELVLRSGSAPSPRDHLSSPAPMATQKGNAAKEIEGSESRRFWPASLDSIDPRFAIFTLLLRWLRS